MLYTLLCLAVWTQVGYAQIFCKKSKTAVYGTDVPRSLETKFDLSGGLIFITDEEGQEPCNFLLDTGAPTLILNEQASPCLSSAMVVGVNGNSSISNKKVKDFSVQGMPVGNMRSYLTDLSSIERVKRKAIKGILGYKVLKAFELFIDYDRRYLMLFEQGASDLHAFIKPVDAIPLYVKGHFPIVKVKIGNRNYFFAIDTGAEVNVINKRWEKKICKKLDRPKINHLVQGLGPKPIVMSSMRLPEISIGEEVHAEMEFVFADLEYLNQANGFELDGILGYPFLSSGKFSINYKDRKLYVWDDPIEEANALERLSQLE